MSHSTRRLPALVLVTAVVVGASVAARAIAADPPYIGKWKFNPAKSELAGDTVTIENAAGGMMRFTSQGFTYTFKLDGKEYPMPDGGTTSWQATSADTWDVTNRANGKVTVTYRVTVKGDSQTVAFSQKKPDGTSVDGSATYKRISGGPGFLGRWRSSDVKAPATLLEVSANGADGLTLKDETGFLCNAKFDGKDYPAGGKLAGTKYAFTLKKTGDRSFEMTTKIDGKPFYVDAMSVSADGKTLTDNGTPVSAKQETVKAVYDRQ